MPNFAYNIKSLQIQRGVGTSSNGTSSYGGSINFESNDGNKNELTLYGCGGDFDTYTLISSYSTGLLNNNFSFYGNITSYRTDGYKYHSGGNGNSTFFSGSYYNNNNILKFTLFSGMSDNNMSWYGVSESDIKIDPRINYNSENEKDNFIQTHAQIQLIHTENDKSTLTNTIYYNRLDGKYGIIQKNNYQ